MSKPLTVDNLINDDLLKAARDELERQLGANRRVRKGGGQYEDVPDNGARRSAAETIVAYKLGRPETRAKNLNATIELPVGAAGAPKGLQAQAMVEAMVAGGVDLNKLAKRLAIKTVNEEPAADVEQGEPIELEVIDFG